MDQSETELIQALLTKVGCIMEDVSIVAIDWSDGLSIEERINKLEGAGKEIAMLVAAARALASIPTPGSQ